MHWVFSHFLSLNSHYTNSCQSWKEQAQKQSQKYPSRLQIIEVFTLSSLGSTVSSCLEWIQKMGFDLPKRIWANEYVRICFIAIGIMVGFLVSKTNQLQLFSSFISCLKFCSGIRNNARKNHQEKLFWRHSKCWRKMRKWWKVWIWNGFSVLSNILVRCSCQRFVKCFVWQYRKNVEKNIQGSSQISSVTFPQLIFLSLKT